MSRHFRRSALLGPGICLLLAGLMAGCENTGAGIQAGTAEAAVVPPPPVNQNIGIYDRTFTGFAAGDCLKCHDGSNGTACPDPTTNCTVLSLRHHVMLDPTSPRYRPGLTCTMCHTPDAATGSMSVTFDCTTCHTTSPHHKTANAQARHCQACHGSVVDNFDDSHYIPTYAKSVVTPDPNCRVWADAQHTTCASGGCRACHVASTSVTPNTANNDTTHHGTGLGVAPNPSEQCGWCHSITTDPNGAATSAIDIRTCETCHGPKSLHGIEFDYNAHNGTAGYGHIGADQDCWGCHGFFAKNDLPPSFGPTISTLGSVQPASVGSGVATEIVVAGQSFANSVTRPDGTVNAYAPVVVLSMLDGDGAEVAREVIAPTRFTESEVRATVPATLRNGRWDVRVYKDYEGKLQVQSNNLPLLVLPRVEVTSAVLSCSNSITAVTGLGFGPQPPPGAPAVGVFAGGAACAVSSWSDTQIVAACPGASPGDSVTVRGIFNGASPASAVMTGSACAAPTAAAPTAAARVTQGTAVCGPSPSCAAATLQKSRLITFDASGSSTVAPAAIRSYSWVITNAAGTEIKKATTASFNVAFIKAGAYTSSLVVTDSAGLASSPAVIAITVQ